MTEAVASEPRQGSASGQGSSRSVSAFVEVSALVLIIGAGLSAWTVGIATRGYDYDEVLRAHSIWLTSQGRRPYSDFFEVHPPYFVLLSPILRSFSDPVDALRTLRVVSALGNLCFLGGLVALGMMSLPPGAGRRWAWLGVAVVAFNPYILDFLVEFRIDGWGAALIAWSTVWYCRPTTRGTLRALPFGALTGIGSVLFCPKLVFLPPLVVFIDLVTRFDSWRGFVRRGAIYVAGLGVAAAIILLYLFVNRIGLERTSLLLGRYHAISNAHAGFRYGLLGKVASLRFPLFLVVAGAAAWGLDCLRRKCLGSPYPPALAVWLLTQSLLVTYPYKQYYAPWFLFAAVFVPSLGPVLDRLLRRGRWLVYVAACVVTIQGCNPRRREGCYGLARFWAHTAIASADERLIRWMNGVATPDDRVVGSPPYHPIDRYDTFFLSFNTSDPKGFDSERIFAELPGLRPFVSAEQYRAELAAHPPALIVLQSPVFEVTHPSRQRAVLEAHMARHGYRTVRVGFVWFAVRPDRFERARREGLLN